MNYESISLPFKKFELEITKGLFEIIQTLKSNEWIVFDDFYNLYVQNVVKKWDAQTKNTVTRNLKKYIAFYKYKYEEIVNNGVKKFKIIRDAGTN